MFRAFAALAAAVGFFGIAVAAAPAQAATLADTAFLTVGGIKYSWDGFDCSPNVSPTFRCANVQVQATANGIEFVPNDGFIVTAGQDISAYIRIDSLTGAPINSYSVVTTGGAVVSPTVPGSVGVSLYTTGFSGISGTNSTTAAGTTSYKAISTTPPRTAVIAGVDMTGNGGPITRVGISVTTVPEPATLIIFATGLAGLAGLRRRKSA